MIRFARVASEHLRSLLDRDVQHVSEQHDDRSTQPKRPSFDREAKNAAQEQGRDEQREETRALERSGEA